MAFNLFFDLETTSLNIEKCQICQLAVVNDFGICLFAKTFGVVLDGIEPAAVVKQGLDYNGYNNGYAELLPCLGVDDLRLLRMLFADNNVWAHNVSFDSAVLKATSLRILGEDIFYDVSYNCTMQLVNPHRRVKLPNLSLESVAHDAVSDTLNCWRLWKRETGKVETTGFQLNGEWK
jgi:DNA polymerase III epsilon subunit-like protein